MAWTSISSNVDDLHAVGALLRNRLNLPWLALSLIEEDSNIRVLPLLHHGGGNIYPPIFVEVSHPVPIGESHCDNDEERFHS